MPEISILLIGNLHRPEFLGVSEYLQSFGQVHRFSTAESAAAALTAGEIVSDITLIVQSYPGEFSQAAIDRLRAASPVSRMIALLGSWCEGEMRTGQPWPTVIRLYWQQGLNRIGREIERMTRGECPNWGLPFTATEEERLLNDIHFRKSEKCGPNFRSGPTGENSDSYAGLIGIAARRFDSFDWLSSACRLRGYATLWLRGPAYPRVEGFTALLIDGTDFQAAESEMIRQLAQRYPKTRSIALMDFPRIEDRHHLESETILLLSKPINVEDLFEKIGQENRKQLPHELIREH